MKAKVYHEIPKINNLTEYALTTAKLPKWVKLLISELYLRLYGHERGKRAETKLRMG